MLFLKYLVASVGFALVSTSVTEALLPVSVVKVNNGFSVPMPSGLTSWTISTSSDKNSRQRGRRHYRPGLVHPFRGSSNCCCDGRSHDSSVKPLPALFQSRETKLQQQQKQQQQAGASHLRLAASSSSSSSSDIGTAGADDDDDDDETPSKPSGYIPPEKSAPSSSNQKANEPPYPKIGDVVRYYDLDGGRADGQVLVGKISLIQPVLSSSSKKQQDHEKIDNVDDDGTNQWLVELVELDNVGDGYYADYPSRKRPFKRCVRKLQDVSPISASYVRSEDAYKVPLDRMTKSPLVRYEQYKLDGYQGPASTMGTINTDVVETDGMKYQELKFQLLRDAAIVGVVGTIIADLIRGLDDAILYGAGALAGVGYLYFLSIKTDTLGKADAKLGNNISNLRFVLPLLVLVGIALKNQSMGGANPVILEEGGGGGISRGVGALFSTVTKEQFAAAMLGFLTYRLPLFLSQLVPTVLGSDGTMTLPGSAGVAASLLSKSDATEQGSSKKSPFSDSDLKTVLLVSGPPGTGKTSLMKRLVAEGNGRFVEPIWVDKITDGAKFERLERREEFLKVDPNGRYGLTREGILNAAASATGPNSEGKGSESKVVVVDADVDLARKLTSLSGARLIGVWVGLDSIEKFESRLRKQVESGDIPVPPDETKESVIRAKIREIVKDIEYGVVSGIFEFTILNDDFEDSVRQLKEAAEYCFK